MEQFAPTARLVPQLFPNAKEDASAPVTAMLVIDNVAVPVLVRVTYCDAVAVPIVAEPNERLDTDRVTGGGRPVPLKAMVCGDVGALSAMVMAAVSAPVVVGAKCPWTVQLAPTAMLVPQLLAKTKEEALVPVTAMLVIDNVVVPTLVITTVCDPLVSPTGTEPYERLLADRVTGRASPVPLSAIVCGEVTALSVMVMDAVNAPVLVGAKWPWMVQLAPAARLAPQLFAKSNDAALAPVTAMLVMDNVAVPVLVSVTVPELPDKPTYTDPRERLVADSVTGGSTPVPLSAMVWGELLALSVMVIAAVSAPVAAGAKCPWIVQLAPAARLVPQLFAKTKEDAFVPVNAMLVMDSAISPGLVSVTVPELLDEPRYTEPNDRLVAESDATEIGFTTSCTVAVTVV